MAFDRVKEYFISYYRQPRIRRGLKLAIVILIGIGWVVSQYLVKFLTLEQTILFALVLLLVSVEIVETKIYDIEQLFRNPVEVFEDNYHVKDEIGSHLASSTPTAGYVISYSGSTGTSKSPTKRLIQKGAKVHLLIKNPICAINQDETELILEALKSRYQFDKDYQDIEIRFYDEQASVKAMKTDNLLVVSWYTFAEERGRKVMGHKNPAVKLTSDDGDGQYEILDDWFTDVYYSLWNSGTTPLELYESDECPESLIEWVDRQVESQREEWLASISGRSYDSREEMFRLSP